MHLFVFCRAKGYGRCIAEGVGQEDNGYEQTDRIRIVVPYFMTKQEIHETGFTTRLSARYQHTLQSDGDVTAVWSHRLRLRCTKKEQIIIGQFVMYLVLARMPAISALILRTCDIHQGPHKIYA
jgi:hypothetical protein